MRAKDQSKNSDLLIQNIIYLDMPEKSASSSSQRSSSSFRAFVTSSSHKEPQVLSGSGSGLGSGVEEMDRGSTVWQSSSQNDPGGVSMAGGGGGAGSRSSWGSCVSWASWEYWGSCGSGRSHSSGASDGRGGTLQKPVSSLTLLLSSSAAVMLTASCNAKQHGGTQLQLTKQVYLLCQHEVLVALCRVVKLQPVYRHTPFMSLV